MVKGCDEHINNVTPHHLVIGRGCAGKGVNRNKIRLVEASHDGGFVISEEEGVSCLLPALLQFSQTELF